MSSARLSEWAGYRFYPDSSIEGARLLRAAPLAGQPGLTTAQIFIPAFLDVEISTSDSATIWVLKF
ncbi:hypothetical protein [Mariniblastus fucicola]|uniref:hypothetical protein n=1 Tax=Mariniblastus fucicola TaxID=980251 RepID=UPI0011E05531|nr:hypothetical protein [Mariniblastus fucicola]